MRTGEHVTRDQLPEALQALRDHAAEFLEQSVADDGGRSQIPTRRLAQHEYRAALHLQVLRLSTALEVHGLFDRRGRLRVVWLTKLESLMREARAFDATLGLARREKRVPSLSEYLASHAHRLEGDQGPGRVENVGEPPRDGRSRSPVTEGSE